MNRRELIKACAAAGAVVAVLGAYTDNESESMEETMEEITYGQDPSQFGQLHRAEGDTNRGTVVVIHGGFWRAAYDLTLGTALAQNLASRGWTAWNLEYRRNGNGGGWPQTFDDIAAGIDKLAEIDGVDLDNVVTLGHSAGGHLAVWAGARNDANVPLTGAIAQAGVLDLAAADRDGLGGGSLATLLGGSPVELPERYAAADPTAQLPLDIPVWCVHGTDDVDVPISQSRDYVDRARAAGAKAELVEVDGDHFTVVDTDSDAWSRTVALLDTI